MEVKSTFLSVRGHRSNRRGQESFGEDLLMHLFLGTTEADALIADQSALQLAQQQLDRRCFGEELPRRRVIPPRRHLRNK